MKTFSRGQQVIVLLIIFGMTLIYFNSINQPQSPQVGRAVPANYRWAQPTLPPISNTPIHSPAPKKLSGAQQLTLNKRINLNMASAADLEAIRGIGPRRAEKIVEYRQRHGRFKRVEDLMNVKGIKEKGLEKVRRYLTVE